MKFNKKTLTSETLKVVLLTFFSAFMIHLFGIVNVLHNYDDISVVRGYGVGLSSGRWGLQLLGDLSIKVLGCFNLSYFNGIIFLLCLSISAGFIYLTFQFDSWKKGVLAGILFISFPSVTSVLFFKYTAVFYGVAILLSVIAVWSAEKIKYGIIVSAFCIAVSVGICQAYLPLSISLFVLLLMKYVVERNLTVKEVFFKGLYFCGCLFIGMGIYFLILKVCLSVYGVSLDDYQGVANMGKLELSQLPILIKKTLLSFVKLPVADYCNLAETDVLKAGYFLLGFICIYAVIREIIIRKKKQFIFLINFAVLGFLFPIAVNFIVIMCPESNIYTLMVYSFVVILFVPLILLNNMNKIIKKITVLILLLIICNYVYLTNVNYTAMYYTNRQTENYLSTMIAQIRTTEGYDASKKWAFIGDNIEDPLIKNPWIVAPLYGGNEATYINRYSRLEWVEKYFGYLINMQEESVVDKLKTDERVKAMPCWPNPEAVKIIDDTVVIKLGDA